MKYDDLPEEVRAEIKNQNFVRAAYLASDRAVSPERTRELQCMAVRNFIEILHNFPGAKKLIEQYELTADEIREIMKDVLENPTSEKELVSCINVKSGKIRSI